MEETNTSKGRKLIEYNKGLIAHLDKTAERAVDDDTMLIYRLTQPAAISSK